MNGRIQTTKFGKHTMIKKPHTLFLLLCIGITACAPVITRPVTDLDVPATAVPPTPQATAVSQTSAITLPLSIYIVDDTVNQFASRRDTAEIAAIYEKVNAIWSQANIIIKVQTIQRLALPDEIVQSIAQGDFRPFFAGIEYDYTIPGLSLLNGFYARSIGGPNGIVPFSADLFFVMDEPSVHDERVTSHEIGHILGLHHTLTDADRLMFSGTNGMALTEEEITVARYVAQGLLDRVR